MAKFTNDKEKQSICIGRPFVYVEKGTNKNGNTYYGVVMKDENGVTIYREFIKYEAIPIWLYLVKKCDYDKYNEI